MLPLVPPPKTVLALIIPSHFSLPFQGKVAEAGALYERCQAIEEAVLGPEHLDVASTLHEWASVLVDQVRTVRLFGKLSSAPGR